MQVHRYFGVVASLLSLHRNIRASSKSAKLGDRSLVATVVIETEAARNSQENLSPGRSADTVQAHGSFREDDRTIEQRVQAHGSFRERDQTIEQRVLPVLLPGQARGSFKERDETIEQRVLPLLLPATLDGSDVNVQAQEIKITNCTCNGGWSGPDGGTGSTQESSSLISNEQSPTQENVQMNLFKAYYKIITRNPAGHLDKKLEDGIANAVKNASPENVMFTFRPIAAALCKTRWQLLLLCLCFLFIGLGRVPFAAVMSRLNFSTSRVRVVALELRSGLSGNAILSPHIQRLELTRGGCPVLPPHEERNLTIKDASMTLHLPRQIIADGCWFEMPASSSAEDDPTKYLIEAYDEDKNLWKTIGSSGMTLDRFGTLTLGTESQSLLIRKNGQRVYISSLPPVWWIMIYVVNSISAGVFFGAMCLCARVFKNVLFVNYLLSMSFFLNYIYINIGSAFLYSEEETSRGIYWSLYSVSNLAFSLLMACRERHFILGMLSMGIYLISYDLIWKAVSGSSTGVPLNGIIVFSWAVIAYISRWSGYLQSKRLIKQDQRCYDEIWASLYASNTSDLMALQGALSPWKDLPEYLCRQYQKRMALFPEFESSAGNWVSASRELLSPPQIAQASMSSQVTGTPPGATEIQNLTSDALSMRPADGIDYSSRVTSLNQLFTQAAGNYATLRKKVQEWALQSHGSFQLKTNGYPEFVRWERVCDKSNMFAKIKWGELKSISRSVEKLLRSYQQDVSRLTDLCRQSIVFDNVRDLTTCINLIAQDVHVRVVRFKNRLDPAFPSHLSAGYRYASDYEYRRAQAHASY